MINLVLIKHLKLDEVRNELNIGVYRDRSGCLITSSRNTLLVQDSKRSFGIEQVKKVVLNCVTS